GIWPLFGVRRLDAALLSNKLDQDQSGVKPPHSKEGPNSLNWKVDIDVSHARGFSREPGQDHRHHNYRDPQYPAFRPFFRLAGLRLLRSIALVSLLVCLHVPLVIAQQTVDEDEVVRVNTDLLLFPVRVRDKKGQAVPGLTEQDLLLKDQDQVTTGLYFSPGADRVALMFALDQSGSLRQIISQQQEAALALFSRFGERSNVAILRFSDTASLVAPFTKDLDAARAAFEFVAAPNQQTAIFDAAAKAVRAFDDLPRVRAERRIVVLISDGLDTRSRTTADSVIDAAVERRVSFYVIHLPLFEPRDGRLAVRRPSKGFRDLAEKTGGKYFLVGNAKSALTPTQNDLTPIFQAIEEDLKSQYLLGFYISESSRDNRKHVFSVSMKREGVEYSVGRFGYSRTQKFFINLPPTK
ncbi:MAG TPA: VWA domain-containing protein, partial [Pyrinomonadaceae bacterium]|nr:VWA domain-containing protein [Pyrinomonadaceae bacterium]